MLIGLIWNQWAGGAAGFLLGSMYALWYSDILYAAQGKNDFSVLGNLVSAMLIGYVAGALNKRSTSYRRLLTAGVIAGIMGSLIIIAANFYSWSRRLILFLVTFFYNGTFCGVLLICLDHA